jgi:hypothetical protein
MKTEYENLAALANAIREKASLHNCAAHEEEDLRKRQKHFHYSQALQDAADELDNAILKNEGLRDQFAMAALSTLNIAVHCQAPAAAANVCYVMADALLKERSK